MQEDFDDDIPIHLHEKKHFSRAHFSQGQDGENLSEYCGSQWNFAEVYLSLGHFFPVSQLGALLTPIFNYMIVCSVHC